MHACRLVQRQYNFASHKIVAMDETAVWNDMVSKTTVEATGAKDVPMKYTGHEKVRVFVCLAGKLDGTKLKPFIVFGDAKRESKSLYDEYKRQCSVASSSNAWMNEKLTLRWCIEVLGQFTFLNRLFACDSFEAHIADEVKRKLTTSKTESLIVPGGCTKYMQAPDLVWNKPFKAKIQEFYDDWLANGVHEYTTVGNMKPAPRRKIAQWVLQAWESFSKEMIINSMKSCVLGLAVDVSEDDKISCFHEGKKTSDGRKRFENQMKLSSTCELNEDPFTHTEEDIIAAAPSFTIIDENDDEDVKIED